MLKKRMLWVPLILMFALLFGSCASTSKAPESTSNQAKSYVAPADRGSVYIYRTGRMVGAAGQLNVKVNGRDAGGTGPGTFFKWDLNPGTYTFFSSTAEASAVVQLEVKAGEVYFIRQDARLGIENVRVTLNEVSAEKGRKEIEGCKLLVSSYVPD